MTAAEKTRLLAERVMGWEIIQNSDKSWDAIINGVPIHDHASWSPLTNLSHAGEVLEAMRAKGWHAVMLCPAEGRHYCEFYRGPMTNRDAAPNGYESLSTAICHAALLAHEVKEEEL